MECFPKIEKIITSGHENIYEEIYSTDEFKAKPSGVIAYIISKNATQNDIKAISEFFEYIVDNQPSNIDTFLVFWLRISNSENIESLVETLERKSEALSNFQNLSASTFIRIIEKIETCTLPATDFEFPDSLTSKQLIDNESKLLRSKRLSLLAGRIYIVAARIFPPFKFSGKTTLQTSVSEGDLLSASIMKMATKEFTEFESKQILDFLEKQPIPQNHKTLVRLPPRPSSCAENIDSMHNGLDLCLILALEGLIHSHDAEEYKKYVLQFSQAMDLPGEDLINIVNRSVTNKEDSHFEFGKELRQGLDINGECNWAEIQEEQFLPSFVVPEDKPLVVEKPRVVTPESAMDEIIQFAGEDKSTWFVGDELKEWRAARLCVAHFMDKLNPDSFEMLE
ncbi:hypothetical protein TVAG_291080 [Trichomonas vaginalis G3]|uniref:Uncharacterized protein n=1 Tax=Trichomonas vaginalis (strain ATCC PRA-98 / G3) TaxID=412133 RepID=A2F3Y6_TRIV3|nr:hypothetical protein TVAGG3_0307700 [Trichomonas vaginalis G3]EAY00402.1 hypothetical protein TVAG_291080 [Trichomonas vaginalis G3]KAI5528371.1 hypothetical protein TVAGG3_0307700 [Trichomonas vaginalis G3]|eukprot:XP_001313331.1 hypothetical protein [Trichomonas vaginalis G3]